MIDLGALKLGIKVDSGEAKEELGNVKSSIKNTASEMKDKIVAGAKAAATGFVALGAAAVGVVESTREYRTEQAKLKTAFQNANFSAKDARKTYKDLNGILGDSGQATEAANHLAKLCNNSKDLSKWTDICRGVYATFGDSLPIEGLTEAANETAKVGQVTGPLADALNWAGISEDDFNAKLEKCGSEQKRQQLITETLTKTYQKASDQYKTNAKDVIAANEANQKMEEVMASLGATLEPIVTTVKILVADILKKLVNEVNRNKDKIQEFVTTIMQLWKKDLKPILNDAIAIIKAIVKRARTNGTMLNTIVKNIVRTVKAAFKVVQDVFKVFKDLFTGDTKALKKDMGTLLKDIIKLIKTVMSNFFSVGKQLLGKLWDGIKSVFGTIKDGIVNFVKEKIIQPIKDKFSNLKTAGKELFTNVWEGIKGVWNNIKSWVSEKVDWLKDKLLFWKKGKKKIDGSHRTGADYIPYDGYIAELHKGEMVLTAAQAREYKNQTTQQQQSAPASNITVNNYSPKALNEAESARLFRQTQRKLVLGF